MEAFGGKKIYDENEEILIKVMKGKVDNTNEMSTYQVDGLSGATLTSNGVSNLLAYWFRRQWF